MDKGDGKHGKCLELTNGAEGRDVQQMPFLHSAATHLV